MAATTTVVSLGPSLLLALTVILLSNGAMAAPSDATADTSPSVVVRAEVQNWPPSVADTSALSLRLTTAETSTLMALRASVLAGIQQRLGPEGVTDVQLEVYDTHADGFRPLVSPDQLKRRRNRLNVILERRTGAVDKETCLALPARIFSIDVERGELEINGFPVWVAGIENSGLGTGLTTWDGSLVLAKYLEHRYAPGGLAGRRVLEVGAGTGLVGLAAALLGAEEVVLTDLEYTMANLARNIERTLTPAATAAVAGGRVRAEVLDWFHPPASMVDVDLLLASDVVWVPELIPPLVETLDGIMRGSRRPPVLLLSHQQRSAASDALLFRELAARGFHRREIPATDLHPDFDSPRIRIWAITLGMAP